MVRNRLSFALLLLVATVATSLRAAAQQTTTVIVVRHAEKAAEPAADPALTAEGEARAKALVDVARDAGVSVVITTPFARTRGTAQPLAAALNITPEVVDARSRTHLQDVAAAIRKHPGATILVVGHSNTVPGIIAALGAKQPPAICDAEYDNLYVVTIPAAGTPGVIHARYGEPSRVTAGCGAMK